MVAGMSVKGSEPRGGTFSHQSRRPGSTGQQTKAKPPAEAIQMARMLEESRYPADLNEKIRQVQAIVPNRSEEEICIALHDNDFDPEKAISALLDSDTPSTGGEWTTSGGRKGKRKVGQNDGIDLIVAPGDTKVHPKKGSKGSGTNRAASQSTREGYGGSVHVSGTDRGKGRIQNGRGRSQSGRRSEQNRGKQSGSSSERRGKPSRDRTNKTNKTSPLIHPPPTDIPDEVWDTLPVENDGGQEVTVNDWTDPNTWAQQQENEPTDVTPYWDIVEDPPPAQEDVNDHPVFPEAIPSQQAGLQLSTPNETTPPLVNTLSTDHTHPQSQTRNEGQSLRDVPEDGKAKSVRKQKRIARSQIPTKPVEMPGGVDTLDLQFGQLGIDFGGLNQDSSPHSTPVAPGYVPDSLLSYTDVHRLSDDPGVISVSTSTLHSPLTTISYRLTEQQTTDATPTLEGPPGLTHPSSASHDLSHDRSLESHDQRLQLGSGVETSASNDQLTLSASAGQLIKAIPTPPLVEPNTTESNSSVLQPPEPIEMPHQTQQKVPSSSQSYSVSGSDLLLSAPTTHTSTQPTTLPPTSTGTHQAGKQGTVPPGMLYPHMMPQYPAFMPMYPAAAANYPDPSDISRYQASVSMAYYPGGGADPALSAAATGGGRDNYSSQDKFGRGADVTPSISGGSQAAGGQASQQGGTLQQGQQMQPAFMNYHMNYPSNMFYPMYFSPAAHSMAPKLSAGATSYPGVSSYQGAGGHLQAGSGYTGYDDVTSHDFTKMYTSSGVGSKSTNLPKSTSGDISLSSAYKPHYESKTNYQGYGLPQSQQYMGAAAAYMQMPTMHVPPMPILPSGSGHDTTRGAQKHSSKGGGYQSTLWGHGGHTS